MGTNPAQFPERGWESKDAISFSSTWGIKARAEAVSRSPQTLSGNNLVPIKELCDVEGTAFP